MNRVPTFEEMQADCAARGCSLERSILSDSEGRWANFYHRPLPDSWQDNPDDPAHLTRVNAWRLGLHGLREKEREPAPNAPYGYVIEPITERLDDGLGDGLVEPLVDIVIYGHIRPATKEEAERRGGRSDG